MPDAHVVDALPEGALLRDALESHIHYAGRVVLDERRAVEACYEGAAVEAVAAVHYVADARGDVQRLRHHSGRHQAHEVGLDLEVKVIGVGIVDPAAGLRRHNALADVVAARLVGVGKVIRRVGKTEPQLLGRGVEAELLEGLGECQVVVDIVEKARLAVPPVLDVALTPADGDFFGNDGPAELELRRGAVDDAYGLPCPAAHDLVFECILGQGDGLRRLGGARCDGDGEKYEATSLHRLAVR